MSSDVERRDRGRSRWRRRFRWLLAAFVYLTTLGAILASYLGLFGVAACRRALTTAGTVRVCQPIGTDDIVAIVLILSLAVLLIWPELSGLGSPNLAALRRRLDAAEAKAERAALDARGLALADPIPDVRVAVEAATARVRALTSESSVAVSSRQPRQLGKVRAESEDAVIHLANAIDRLLSIPTSPDPVGELHGMVESGVVRPGDLYEYRRLLGRWQGALDAELRTMAAVRNQVANFPERLADDEVSAGVDLGNLLLDSLTETLAPARTAPSSDRASTA